MRLDLFLKASRLVKRRAVAREMCDAGGVLVNGHEAKPAREVKQGDHVTLQFRTKSIELEVLVLPLQKSMRKEEATGLYRVTAEKMKEHEDLPWRKNPS